MKAKAEPFNHSRSTYYMRILIAPQSLKGSLTAAEAGQAIATGAKSVFPEAEITIIPVADGGEGTVQALVDATSGSLVQRTRTARRRTHSSNRNGRLRRIPP